MKQLALAVLALAATASAAGADCLADFKALNTVKAEAGPFRVDIKISVVPPTFSDKKPAPVLMKTITTEVMPLKSYHMVQKSKGGTVDVIVLDRTKAWAKGSEGWKPIAAENMADLVGAWPTSEYFATAKLFNLSCGDERPFKGKTALAFEFDGAPQNSATHTTAFFDPSTRLPLGSVIAVETAASAVGDTSFVFDRSINIVAPTN